MRWKRKIHHGGSSQQQHVGSILADEKRPISTFKLLSGRESNCSGIGRFSSADCSYALRKYLPVKGPWCVDDMDSEAYISQFSADGSLLVGGFRGSHIRVYNSEKKWKVHKDITCKRLRWTVSDIALSPDQRFLEIHEGLEFSDDDDGFSFGIFSVKFSKDGRELVVGNNNESICIYDLGSNKVTERINAHVADVNVVTFADETSDVLYSGSDDSLCKVWDRRCHNKQKPVGILTGHLDGITFIDSRGDGHYFISNCKDQTIKLWDLRKMSSSTKE
ncbi:LEC14B-like protein [Dichanthelium oligosanthes]|uniref:LEC14B-like protein n=1 Tax=Dichanthelium oligosanthes TaxID=888268 RepID=A0A1E5W4N6_9POAL|nr:LEC14B-like protein [Dichanthelium oligosanthes]